MLSPLWRGLGSVESLQFLSHSLHSLHYVVRTSLYTVWATVIEKDGENSPMGFEATLLVLLYENINQTAWLPGEKCHRNLP